MAATLIYITLNRMIYDSNQQIEQQQQQQQHHEPRQLDADPPFCLLVKKTTLLIAIVGSNASPCGNLGYGWWNMLAVG